MASNDNTYNNQGDEINKNDTTYYNDDDDDGQRVEETTKPKLTGRDMLYVRAYDDAMEDFYLRGIKNPKKPTYL